MSGSHIQMPKGILRRFEDKNHTLIYIDCKIGIIKLGRAKSLYTEYGYYSREMENWLNREIETPVTSLIAKLSEMQATGIQSLSEQDSQIVYNYLCALVARSPYALDLVLGNSRIINDMGHSMQHDYSVFRSYKILKENIRFENRYTMGIIINNSEEAFVLPTGGICQTNRGLICPVSPMLAFLFERKVNDESVIPLDTFDDIEQIRIINRLSYIEEKNHACKYVVSNNRSSLEEILTTEE